MKILKKLKNEVRTKMKRNKAQISSQIFVYILAAVIIAVILLVGYKAISTILGFTSKVPIDDFKIDFESEVHKITRSYGSIKKFEFTLPEKFDTICFIDSMNENNEFEISANIGNAFIEDIVSDNVQKNVFLLKEDIIEESFYVENMDVSEDYLCVENQGLMKIWFEGAGKKACLKKEQEETC